MLIAENLWIINFTIKMKIEKLNNYLTLECKT